MTHFVQKGFTLIELLVSLVLGLLIIAAGTILFITGQRSYSVQQGAAEIQNNANFGLNLIAKNIRHTNLDATVSKINDRTHLGGIVFSSSVNPYTDTVNGGTKLSNLPSSIPSASAPLTLMSRSNGQQVATVANHWKGESNVVDASTEAELKSDQLVIQYRPVLTGGFDCEGNEITTTDKMVIERYFLRVDSNAAPNEPNKALALACDAGRFSVVNPTAFENYGDAGQIIMQRVDYFRVLLGIEEMSSAAPRRRFVDIKTYLDDFPSNATVERPKIKSIQIGILSRSTSPVGDDDVIKSDQAFTIMDQTVKVKTSTATPLKYVRQVVSQTVALRNASGE